MSSIAFSTTTLVHVLHPPGKPSASCFSLLEYRMHSRETSCQAKPLLECRKHSRQAGFRVSPLSFTSVQNALLRDAFSGVKDFGGLFCYKPTFAAAR